MIAVAQLVIALGAGAGAILAAIQRTLEAVSATRCKAETGGAAGRRRFGLGGQRRCQRRHVDRPGVAGRGQIGEALGVERRHLEGVAAVAQVTERPRAGAGYSRGVIDLTLEGDGGGAAGESKAGAGAIARVGRFVAQRCVRCIGHREIGAEGLADLGEIAGSIEGAHLDHQLLAFGVAHRIGDLPGASGKGGVGIRSVTHFQLHGGQTGVVAGRAAEAQDVGLRAVAVRFGQLAVAQGNHWCLAIRHKAHHHRWLLSAAPIGGAGGDSVDPGGGDRYSHRLDSLLDPCALGKADGLHRRIVQQDHKLFERLVGASSDTNLHIARTVDHAALGGGEDDRLGNCGGGAGLDKLCPRGCDKHSPSRRVDGRTVIISVTRCKRAGWRLIGGPERVGVDQRGQQRQVGELLFEQRVVVKAAGGWPLAVAGAVEGRLIELEIAGTTGIGDLIALGVGCRIQIGLTGGPSRQGDARRHGVDQAAPDVAALETVALQIPPIEVKLVESFQRSRQR